MNINKKFIAIMMTLAIGGSLVGCGQSQVPETPGTGVVTPEATPEGTPEVMPEGEEVAPENSALAQVVTTITEGMELPMQGPMIPEMFEDTYGIDTSLLKDYYVSMSMMNVHATEIAVFELNDEKDAEIVMEGIEKRQKALEEQWKTYLPDQYEIVKNYKTAQKGNKILFVINESADKIVENFNNLNK